MTANPLAFGHLADRIESELRTRNWRDVVIVERLLGPAMDDLDA